jgi:hypothetical protein
MSIWQVTGYWLVFFQPWHIRYTDSRTEVRVQLLDWVIVIQSILYGANLAERVTTV